MSNRLDTIVTRQRRLNARDLWFAAFIVLAAIIALATVVTA